MNRSQQVKKIIGSAIEDHGFEYKGYDRDEYVSFYSFEKKDGDLEQYITIVVSGGKLRLELGTNAYGQKDVRASALIDSKFKGGNDGLVFESDEDFKEILSHFKEIILQKGFEILDSISVPTSDEIPTRRTETKLFQEHEALNKEYREKYGITETATTKVIKKISDIILENKDKPFKEVEELLIGLAAVYGCQMVKKCGGHWEFDDESASCMIEEKLECECERPLLTMIWYWKHREEYLEILLQEFREDGIGRLH